LLAKVQIFQDSQRDVIEDLQDISAHASIFVPNWKSLTQLLFNYILNLYIYVFTIQGHAQNQRPNQNTTLIEANFPQFDLVVATKKTKNYKHQT